MSAAADHEEGGIRISGVSLGPAHFYFRQRLVSVPLLGLASVPTVVAVVVVVVSCPWGKSAFSRSDKLLPHGSVQDQPPPEDGRYRHFVDRHHLPVLSSQFTSILFTTLAASIDYFLSKKSKVSPKGLEKQRHQMYLCDTGIAGAQSLLTWNQVNPRTGGQSRL